MSRDPGPSDLERIVDALERIANALERRERRTSTGPLARVDVRQIPCPTCKAAAGEPCQGRRGARTGHHNDRVRAARDVWRAIAARGGR